MLARESLMAVAVLPPTRPVAVQSPPPLGNDAVVRMVRARVAHSIVMTTVRIAPEVEFDLSPAGLIALREAGVHDDITRAMIRRAHPGRESAGSLAAAGNGAERSESLPEPPDPQRVLRNFRTLAVDASRAKFFRGDQVKAELFRNKGFSALNITLVDNPVVADVVLDVSYTFAWDYPFTLRHQNTSMVLGSGKGVGPFSGPLGAASVAARFVRLVRGYRVATPG